MPTVLRKIAARRDLGSLGIGYRKCWNLGRDKVQSANTVLQQLFEVRAVLEACVGDF